MVKLMFLIVYVCFFLEIFCLVIIFIVWINFCFGEIYWNIILFMVMFFIRWKCWWSKGKEGVYVVSLNVKDLFLGKEELKMCKWFYFDIKVSISFRGSIVLLDINDDFK